MKKTALLLSLLSTALIFASKPTSYLMPNTQVFLIPELDDGTQAFYLSGVMGPKNYQAIATYGSTLGECHRFKITGDYLTQKLRYGFDLGGDEQKWVHQAGAGAAYQYIFDYNFFKTIDAGASFSHAHSRSLPKREFLLGGSSFTLKRRIAGANALLSYLGATVRPWHCGLISAAINYDYVLYERKLEKRRHVEGVGASLNYTQQMGRAFLLEFDADIRRPFQFYQSTFSWDKNFSNGQLTLGAFGSYTVGNKQLPNVAAAGIQLGFAFGSNCSSADEKRCDYTKCHDRFFCDIGQWVLDPPLLPPVVLAIPEEILTQPVCAGVSGCCQPVVVHQFRDFRFPSTATTLTIPLNAFDYCNTYSLAVSPNNGNVSIDPTSGVITYTNIGPGTYNLDITTTNNCGNSASESFNVIQQ